MASLSAAHADAERQFRRASLWAAALNGVGMFGVIGGIAVAGYNLHRYETGQISSTTGNMGDAQRIIELEAETEKLRAIPKAAEPERPISMPIPTPTSPVSSKPIAQSPTAPVPTVDMDAQRELRSANERIAALDEQIAYLNNQLAVSNAEKDTSNADTNNLTLRLQETMRALEKANADAERRRTERDAAAKEAGVYRARNDALRAQLSTASATIERLQAQLQKPTMQVREGSRYKGNTQ